MQDKVQDQRQQAGQEDRDGTRHRPPGVPRRRRRWAVPVGLGGGLLGLALLAWLTTPAWLPGLAAGYLPEGWRPGDVTLERPGLRRLRVPLAEATGEVGGLRVRLRIEDGAIRYEGPGIAARRLLVDLSPQPDGPESRPGDGLAPQDLALPRLLPPGGLPATRIDDLVVTWNGADGERRWDFAGIDLDPAADVARLTARLDPPNGFGTPLDLALELSTDRLGLSVRRPDRATPLLTFTQSPIGNGDAARATMEIDLDVETLDPALLSPATDLLGLGEPGATAGRLRAAAVFQGEDTLRPEHCTIDLDAVRIDAGPASFAGDLALDARRAGDTVTVRVDRLALTLDGGAPAIDERLRAALAPLGLEPLLDQPERRMDLRTPAAAKDEAEATTLSLGVEEPNALRLRGALSLDARFGPSELALALPRLDLSLANPDLPREAAFDGAFELTADLRQPLVVRAGDVELGATSTVLDLDGTAARDEAGSLRAQGGPTIFTLDDFTFSNPSTTLRLARLEAGGGFSLDDRRLVWNGPLSGAGLIVAPADAIAASNLLTAAGLSFQLEAAGDERIAVSGSGRLDGVQLPDLGITLDGVDVDVPDLSLPATDGRLGLLTTGLEATLDGTRYTGVDLDVRGDLRGGSRFDGSGELLVGFSGTLPFGFSADLDAATVRARLSEAPLKAGALGDAARALALPLPRALAFTDGRLVLDGEVRVGEAGLGGDMDVRGDALAFSLGESRFEDLDFTTRVALDEVVAGNGPLTLRLARLAAGLDLVALDTAVSFRGADVGLSDLDAEILGGRLSSPGIRLSGGELMDTVIRWEGFDLARLLAFVDVTGLEGSGILDAEFPVVNDGRGPAVRDGWFRARGPGRLRYSTGVPATNIGLQALENFQYDTLEGTLAYGSEGAYTIGVDLLGRNPDLYGGHPVRFRLNIGGELPALFRSLFVTGDFEEGIIERLRAGESPLEETP